MDIDKIMEMLHKELTEDLLSRVKSGAATAAELNVARQLLKDNGIVDELTLATIRAEFRELGALQP